MEASNVIAVVALFVGIVSLSCTMVSSYFQIKHNKNSVMPVCSIYLTNYANFISVRIENNGTGPLIIKDIKYMCEKNSRNAVESASLYNFLPEKLKTMIFHRLFPSMEKGRAISANCKIFLLSISSDDNPNYDDNVATLLRDALKEIEISVTYTDIYGTKFEPVVKKLDLFSEKPTIRMTDPKEYVLRNS